MSFPASKAILSPCTGICRLGADGLCEGCLRTGDEIARWISMNDAERSHLMFDVLPKRGVAEHGA